MLQFRLAFALVLCISTQMLLATEPSTLIQAILSNDVDIVESLANPKTINEATTNAPPAIFYAILTDNTLIAEKLLKQGANPNIRMQGELTPLYFATSRNQIGMVNLLLKFKANVNDEVKGTTPLDMAIAANYNELKAILYKHNGIAHPQLQPLNIPASRATPSHKIKP